MSRVTPLFEDSRDEDSLDRETDSDEAGEFLKGIVRRLHEGPSGVRSVRLVARTLEDLAQASLQADDAALEQAYRDALEALRELTG